MGQSNLNTAERPRIQDSIGYLIEVDSVGEGANDGDFFDAVVSDYNIVHKTITINFLDEDNIPGELSEDIDYDSDLITWIKLDASHAETFTATATDKIPTDEGFMRDNVILQVLTDSQGTLVNALSVVNPFEYIPTSAITNIFASTVVSNDNMNDDNNDKDNGALDYADLYPVEKPSRKTKRYSAVGELIIEESTPQMLNECDVTMGLGSLMWGSFTQPPPFISENFNNDNGNVVSSSNNYNAIDTDELLSNISQALDMTPLLDIGSNVVSYIPELIATATATATIPETSTVEISEEIVTENCIADASNQSTISTEIVANDDADVQVTEQQNTDYKIIDDKPPPTSPTQYIPYLIIDSVNHKEFKNILGAYNVLYRGIVVKKKQSHFLGTLSDRRLTCDKEFQYIYWRDIKIKDTDKVKVSSRKSDADREVCITHITKVSFNQSKGLKYLSLEARKNGVTKTIDFLMEYKNLAPVYVGLRSLVEILIKSDRTSLSITPFTSTPTSPSSQQSTTDGTVNADDSIAIETTPAQSISETVSTVSGATLSLGNMLTIDRGKVYSENRSVEPSITDTNVQQQQQQLQEQEQPNDKQYIPKLISRRTDHKEFNSMITCYNLLFAGVTVRKKTTNVLGTYRSAKQQLYCDEEFQYICWDHEDGTRGKFCLINLAGVTLIEDNDGTYVSFEVADTANNCITKNKHDFLMEQQYQMPIYIGIDEVCKLVRMRDFVTERRYISIHTMPSQPLQPSPQQQS